MELSNSAREVIVQAQTLLLKTGGKKLCVEHLFYGILLLAGYLDPPFNGPEFREDGEKLRKWLEDGRIRSVASARKQLEKDAAEGGSMFTDAAPVLGRAAEIAGVGEIGPIELARAIIEANSPTVMALQGLINPNLASEDARYRKAPRNIKQKNINNNPQKAEPPKQQNILTTSQIEALLHVMASDNDRQLDELRRNSVSPPPRKEKDKPRVVRRTKMGPFTYRGGTVAAAFQYFLFGIIVPAAILFLVSLLLAKTMGSAASTASPLVSLFLYAYICIWLHYLARGVVLLLGLISNVFGHFLNILLDLMLVGLLTVAIEDAFGMPSAPLWLRVVSSLAGFLVLSAGIGLFDHLRNEDDVTKTRVLFQNKEGTPGKIFFQSFTESIRLAYVIFALLWITRFTLPPLAVHILWILGFFWVWNNVFNAYACLCIRCTAGRHRGKGLFEFLYAAHLFFAIPEFVVFLHWHFQWFPMKLWVRIILIACSVIAVLFSTLYARIK